MQTILIGSTRTAVQSIILRRGHLWLLQNKFPFQISTPLPPPKKKKLGGPFPSMISGWPYHPKPVTGPPQPPEPRPRNQTSVEVDVLKILKHSYMGVSENGGFSPQIIHFNRVFHYFHHPFGGTPYFGNTHSEKRGVSYCCWKKSGYITSWHGTYPIIYRFF